MDVEFTELLDFFYKTLPKHRVVTVAMAILTDESVGDILAGIKVLHDEHGSRKGVEAYLKKSTEAGRRKFEAHIYLTEKGRNN